MALSGMTLREGAVTAEDEETPVRIGAQLAEVHVEARRIRARLEDVRRTFRAVAVERLIHEAGAAARELRLRVGVDDRVLQRTERAGHRLAHRVRAGDGLRAGRDVELRRALGRIFHFLIARRMLAAEVRARILERPVLAEEGVIRRLLVRELHGPGDVRVVRGELADRDAVAVVAVDSKARRLPLDAPLRVLEAIVARLRHVSGRLGPDEELVRTVPDAGNTDAWMDLAIRDLIRITAHGLLPWPRACEMPRRRTLRSGNFCWKCRMIIAERRRPGG
jgi:hypothetical protein